MSTDRTISCNAALVQPFSGTGPWYLANAADADPATGVGILGTMLTPDAVFALPQSQNGLNQLSPSDYWIIGTTTGDKATFAYWVA